MKSILGWLDDRLGFSATVKPLIEHPVTPTGWDYTLGSATLIAFIVQVVTGVALAFSYVPTPDHAYESLALLVTDGDYQSTPGRQLFHQRFGQFRSAGRDDNAVVRRMFGPAERAIADVKRNILIA